jgi:hypothetical protein
MRELGFRRKAEQYWQCERRFGLPENGYLSVFSWSEQAIPGSAGRRFLVELSEFHVTFLLGFEHVHFYYHERSDNDWMPEGHTSRAEIRRLGEDPHAWRERADGVAATLVAALQGVLYPRDVLPPNP